MSQVHSFHIPVMGIAFTLDTPLKVAHYGIDSVVSLVDDLLMEKMRELYSKEYLIAFESISNNDPDYRAKRITAYLNLLHEGFQIQIPLTPLHLFEHLIQKYLSLKLYVFYYVNRFQYYEVIHIFLLR